jgi:hypothetical protein
VLSNIEQETIGVFSPIRISCLMHLFRHCKNEPVPGFEKNFLPYKDITKYGRIVIHDVPRKVLRSK